MNQKKKCPVIVLCILFAFSIFILPAIIGLLLWARNCNIDKENKQLGLDMESKINRLKSEISNLNFERERLYAEIADKAKADALKQAADEVSACERKVERLNAEISSRKYLLDEKNSEYAKLCKSVESNAKKVDKLKEIYKSFQYAIKAYESGSDSYLDEALISSADQNLSPIVELKINCMNVKQLRAKYNDLQKNIREAFRRYEGRYTTKSNAAIYKLMVIALEAELQNVLASLKYGNLEDSIESVKNITAHYLTIAVDGNQSIAPTMKKFIAEIEYLFIESVKVEYEYYQQKQRIKEEQQALKEKMRQEAAERKALEEERKKIEKEEAKYKNQIGTVEEQLSNCTDEDQIQKLKERIEQLQRQMNSVEEKKEKIVQLQNGKAGYVYVISNLGSFGDHVFKVGMTRRQEPMDRVRELGDASVPFAFDVHSFIFSEDAVTLETTLHHELNNKRVNKINLRKEFFDVTLDELEELVYKYEPTAEFNRTMLAEEYRQGLSLNEEMQEISDEDLQAV